MTSEHGPTNCSEHPADAGLGGMIPGVTVDAGGLVALDRLARQPTTDVADLDRVDATNVGRLLAASSTADVVDAHVVVCARRAHQRIVTSDPDDLRRLDPTLDVVAICP